MIVLDKWKIKTPEDIDTQIIKRIYARAYIGNELNPELGNPNIDDRLQWMKEFIGKSANTTHTTTYDIDNSEIQIESDEKKASYSVNNLSNIGNNLEGRVLIDATSLLLPELLYLLYWANTTQQRFDVMYVEPSGYKEKPDKPKIGSHRLDYSLSEDGPGLCMLPRYALPMDGSHLVVALGYEGHRFGSLLISDEINPANISGILGVPPFELGMEKNSYARNYSIMEEARKNCDANFHAIAANDPLQNYQLLKTIFQSEAASLRPNRKLHLAPFGTKPVALGMAWFAINNKGVSIIYDFVKKKRMRSVGVGKIHFWRFSVT
jgi:hypothetical protein